MYKNFATIILSIIFSIFLLEFIFFFSDVSDAQLFRDVTKNNKISHYQKNKKYSFSRGSFFEVKSKKSTNNYGYFSSKDYLINKNLVAVIGDSYVVASEVDNDETFHSLLDKEINQDVYAFGVNSDQLSQYLFNTQWVTKKFKPNIIIYSIVLNDFETSFIKYSSLPGKHYFRYSNTDKELDLIEYKNSKIKNILRKSALMRYLIINVKAHTYIQKIFNKKNLLYGNKIYKKTNQNIIFEDGKKAINMFIDRIEEISKKNDIKIVLLFDGYRSFLYKNQNHKKYIYYKLANYMKEKAITKNFYIVEMHDVFKKNYTRNKKKFEFEVDYHWNEMGHKLVADELLKLNIFK